MYYPQANGIANNHAWHLLGNYISLNDHKWRHTAAHNLALDQIPGPLFNMNKFIPIMDRQSHSQ